MEPALIEMRPNRSLLSPDFDGYKLSLENIASAKKELVTSVDRILLNSTQYSLLHVKLFGLHNHLTGETIDGNDSVYFIDKQWNLCKTYVDVFNFEFVDPIKLWQVPRARERESGDYNVTFKFANDNIAVLTDGIGTLYILNTGSKSDDDIFSVVYSEEVTHSEKGFIIMDVVHKQLAEKEELHVLLISIEQLNLNEIYTTVINWVTLSKVDGKWGQTALRKIQVKGDVQYLAFEKSCEAIYLASDTGAKFTINSEYPIMEDLNSKNNTGKSYMWTQTNTDITITLPLPDNFVKNKLDVTITSDNINLKYEDDIWLNGTLHKTIKADLTVWTVNNNTLEIQIVKDDANVLWSLVVEGNTFGTYITPNESLENVTGRLTNLTSDTEANPISGATFNSQEVEDCDLEYDKTVIFERVCGKTSKTINKVNIGSNPVLVTANMNKNLTPALGIRHDVDILLWQPQESNGEFSIKHEGTLHAFGYVQASKQQRKFTVCSPDLNNIAICQSSRYLFLYKQKRAIASGELRNRTTGRYIPNMAQQFVINIPNEEVLGIYISNKQLFLLADHLISVFKID